VQYFFYHNTVSKYIILYVSILLYCKLLFITFLFFNEIINCFTKYKGIPVLVILPLYTATITNFPSVFETCIYLYYLGTQATTLLLFVMNEVCKLLFIK